MNSCNTYELSAKYYDSAYKMINLVDVDFYVGLAKKIDGPVLEVGCGTGRVLMEIARAGIEIHGVDKSSAMLAVLREKLKLEPKKVQNRITIHSADMRTMHLNKTYPLIIIPFRPLQHLHTMEDQLTALRTAAVHMNSDGRLVFDVFYPQLDAILSGIGKEYFDMEWTIEGKPGMIIRRFYRKEYVDKINQNFRGTFIFRTFKDEDLICEETAPLHMTWYYYPEVRALLALAGLEIVDEYGSFTRSPLDNSSSEMIFLVKKWNNRKKRDICRTINSII